MAVRPKTRRRLQILLVGALALLVLGSGGYVLRKRQVAAQVLQGREAGYAALEAGDHYTALHKIGPYLQRHPDDPDALHKYALARMNVEEPNGKHLADAMSLYRRLLELQPDNEKAREELLDLYLHVNFNAEVLSRTEGRGDPVSLRTRTMALVQTGRTNDAQAPIQKYNDLRPLDLRMQVLSLQLMMSNGAAPGAALDRATALQKAHPDDPKFELLVGTAFAMAQDRERAVEWTRKAVARRLQDPELLDMAVDLLDRLGMHGESLAALRQGADAQSGLEFKRRLARRLYQSGNFQDAAQLPVGAEEDLSKADPGLLAHRAMALMALGKRDESTRVIEALATRKGERSAEAWANVLKVLPQKDTLPDDKRIIEACREGLQTLPENPYFHQHLGDAYARLGETELALREWQTAAKHAQAWPVPTARLVRLLTLSRRPELLEAANHLATLAEHDADSLAMAAWARATAQPKPTAEQAQELLKLVDRVQSLRPNEPLSLRLKVHLLAQSGDANAARETIKELLAAQPPLPRESLIALAGASAAAELGLENQTLDLCGRAHGNSAALAATRATLLVRAGKRDEAKRAFESSRAAAADRDSLEWQLGWAQLNETIEDPSAAQSWSALAAARPDDPLIQLAVMSAKSAQADRELIRRAIDGVGKVIGSEGVTWRVADARWILQGAVARAGEREREQDLVKAASILNDLARRYPENVQARLLLGDALAQLGKKDAAIEHLTAVAGALPNSWPVALQLASLLQSQGDFEKARPHLERAEQLLEREAQRGSTESIVDNVAEARPAAAAASAAQRPVGIVTTSPNTEAAWRTLAALLGARGETEHAVKILSRLDASAGAKVDLALVELQRKAGTLTEQTCLQLLKDPTPAAIGIVADSYAASGRADDAARTIALLDNVKADAGEREFVRGIYLQRAGKQAEAIAQLRAACDAAPKNAQAWRALVTLLLSSKQFDDGFVAAARASQEHPEDAGFRRVAQNRELLLATSEAAPARGLAVALASENPQADMSIEALRIVESGLKSKQTVAQVATKLRPLSDRAAAFAPLQNLLIDLYMAQRDFDAAGTLASRLAQLAPADPAPAERVAQALAAAGKWDQVIGAAQEWRRRAGANTREPDEMLANAYLATSAFAAAERQLAPYAERASKNPGDWVTFYSLYSQAIAAQGRIAEAETFFATVLPVNAQLRQAWITTAVRAINDVTAAGDWLEKVKPFIPADAIDEHLFLASARVELSRRPSASPAERTAASAALADVGERAKITAGVKADHWVALGAMREMLDDRSGAETDYRAALRLDPNHAIALNNLAMLIVRRDGDLNEAKDLAARATASREHPSAADILDTLAQVQTKLGHHADAATALRQAVALRPAQLSFHVALLESLLSAGAIDEARKSLSDLDELVRRSGSVAPELRERTDKARQRLSLATTK